MSHPKYLIRPSDGERFVLCEDENYRIEAFVKKWPDHLHSHWSYEVLKSYKFLDCVEDPESGDEESKKLKRALKKAKRKAGN